MSQTLLQDSVGLAAAAGCWFVGGTLLGFAHFRALRWNVRCVLGGHALLSLLLQVLRFAATGAALTLAARWFGALPLLAGALGLLASRTAVLLLEPRR